MYSRRSRQTGVHLNDSVVSAVGVQGVLHLRVSSSGRVDNGTAHVALSDDTNVSNNLDGGRSKHVVLVIGQRLRRGNDDRVSSMCAEGVEVFHVAANDDVLWSGQCASCLFRALTSAASRTTSYSTSFHPLRDFSIRTCGESDSDLAAKFRSSSSSWAKPEPRPPSEKAERRMMGYPISWAASSAAWMVDTAVD